MKRAGTIEETETVLFTGPTGVRKDMVQRKIVEYFLRFNPDLCSRGIKLSPDDEGRKSYIQDQFSVEDEIERISVDLPTFLDETNRNEQERIYRDAMAEFVKNVRDVRGKVHLFMQVHTCFFRGHNRFSFWKFSDFQDLHPTCIITLVDDAYSIWYRVNRERPEIVETGSYLRLEDILEWRSFEILLSERIAASLNIDHFVVPVKHPVQNSYYLIFERAQRALLYASYPMTEPRKSIEGQREVNDHRRRLYQLGHIVFDPVTIDEGGTLSSAYIRRFREIKPPPAQERFEVNHEDRWLHSIDEFPPTVDDSPGTFPLELYAEEAYLAPHVPFAEGREELSRIGAHIQDRDFRFIRSADLLAAYRPYWQGLQSEGMTGEIAYARGKKPIFLYHPDEDQRSSHPFRVIAGTILKKDLGDFYESVEKRAQFIVEKRGADNGK
jgi:hypothetical protein